MVTENVVSKITKWSYSLLVLPIKHFTDLLILLCCSSIGSDPLLYGVLVNILRKISPMPLCPPQIVHDQTWDQNRTNVVGIRRNRIACPVLVRVWWLGVGYRSSTFWDVTPRSWSKGNRRFGRTSSGPKNKRRKKPAWKQVAIAEKILLGLGQIRLMNGVKEHEAGIRFWFIRTDFFLYVVDSCVSASILPSLSS
jgi:hypothetical protein